MGIIAMDNQPVSARFFNEGRWLTDFITPKDLEVQSLYRHVAGGMNSQEERLSALHRWVGRLKYKQLISGMMRIEGKVSYQNDLWNDPATTIRVGVGNCANKSFLLASLFRQELDTEEVYVVLGNLHNGKVGGHAWVVVKRDGTNYIVESTRPDVPTMVPAESTNRYEAVHFFNDRELYAVENRTVLTPFMACYSTWLRDYLDMAYIEGRK